MRILFFWFIVMGLMVSCSPLSRRSLNKRFQETEAKFQDHTGFMLYDLSNDKTVYEYNSSKYFTPASNTKIFTLFAGLKILGDSVPALRYRISGDSLIFWGTGDPSFLYKNVYNNNKVFSFLSSTDKKLFFSATNYNTPHFGSGWAWDDYNSAYSAEKSPFPVYGNILSISGSGQRVEVQPSFFKKHLIVEKEREKSSVIRSLENNELRFYPSAEKKFEEDIPIRFDYDLTTQLLEDTLGKEVQHLELNLMKEARTIYSLPSDSLYRVMMQDSDNFIAEQMLLLCSGIISDTLKPEIAIKYVKKHFLNEMIDDPVWVDGSGLSRYNLFTPRSVVQLWGKIYQLVPRERLFAMLATGGKSGTIRNWYKADKPYIFGKTGSLSNNHCLSGYLVTRKGKTLIFSFMNSNFTASTKEMRTNMQSILNLIYEKY